ncbi:hypothetical protein [Erythrobacter sp. 3-20A1M]|uniref:hypothetical protein n=1 Tax=Erythrobacter sp. 3-20A1M TaxID=2653850 RepID=UPI001BFC2049|nr:hypothetical protein [Erythrobacter sp. 3-20A1M]
MIVAMHRIDEPGWIFVDERDHRPVKCQDVVTMLQPHSPTWWTSPSGSGGAIKYFVSMTVRGLIMGVIGLFFVEADRTRHYIA